MKRILLSAAMIAAISASAQTSSARAKYVSTVAPTIDTELVLQADVRLTRTLYFGYNSLCLPYGLSADEVAASFGAGVKLEKPVGAYVDGNDFVLCFADCTSEGIEAGMPYLVYSDKARYVSLFNHTGVSTSIPASVTFGDGQGNVATFRGSFERLAPVGTYAIPAVEGEIPSNLICCDGARQLNPTRCFFTWDTMNGAASNMVIRHLAAGESVTSIHAAVIAGSDASLYNTSGQRVTSGRGVMIQGGKKVVK